MRRTALIALCILFCSTAWAQTGFPPFGSIESSGFDNVNRQNLNVQFQIPLFSTPGRGLPFSPVLSYNSLIWTKVGSFWTPVVDESGAPTWGWGRPLGTTKYTLSRHKCTADDGSTQWVIRYNNYSHIDPSGTSHAFPVYIERGPAECIVDSTPTGYATDGSGYFLDANSPTSPKVFAPAGVNLVGGVQKDANGNYITTTVNGNETDWIDTLGRTALKVIKNTNDTQYQYQDSAGQWQTVKLNLSSTSKQIKTNFGCGGGTVEYTGTAMLPDTIDLPNNTHYTFIYEPTPGASNGEVTGRIKRVTLPTGGYYEYTYPGANDGINCTDGTVNNMTRVINDGTTAQWIFARAQVGSDWKTTVIAPVLPYDLVGNQSVFTFNSSGQLTSQKFYQGSTTGTLLRTVNTTWANGTPSSTTSILENNQQSKVDTTFDTYGNLTQLIEYDWGSGAPGSAKRTTSLTYLSTSPYISANIVNRVTQVLVRDGGPTGTVKSRTVIAYDGTSLTSVTGAAHHDDSGYGSAFTTRGNPTSVTTYTDAATPAGPIVKNFSYDSLGNVRSADVNCCQQKQWNYSSTTQYAYPDSVVSGPTGGPQLTTSATYYFNTGLVATSTDENGKVTAFTYDLPTGRPLSVQRPDNATISYTYDDVARTATVGIPLVGTSQIIRTTYSDSLGRPFKVVTVGGGTTYSISESRYDTLSRAYLVATPHNSTAQYWTETRFDALGRPTVVIPPDGSPSSNNTSYSYSGNTVTVTDPAGKQLKQQTDGLGRLVVVYEPDVNNGNALTQQTSYAYSPLDLLLGVTQGAQTRTYAYDGLGRLTSAATPETNSLAYQYQYNSFDQVTQRTDPRGVITSNTYDTLNRPYQVSYNVGSTGVPATSTVTYTYGTSSASNNNGRLSTVTDGPGSESYTYDILGQVTQVQKVISSTTYTTSYAYNLAGELTSITYPSGRVVQQNYDSIGRLSTILNGATNYASSFNYNPAGQVTGFSYGNGVTATYGYAPERLLLSTVSYAKSGQTLFSLSYGYIHPNNGKNGQITSMTDNVESGRTVNYTYDALYRVSTAQTTGSGTYPQWGLSWTYDRYGNRTNQTVTAGTAPASSLGISTTTNRITGDTYDANGNLTFEPGTPSYSYQYDAENRLVDYQNGGATYAYDGASLRVKKILGGTTTVHVFSGTKVIAEYVNGAQPTAPTREYIHSGAQLLATIEGSTTKYHHADRLSPRLTTDSSGTRVGEQGHYPFGEPWYQADATTKWQFTSYERDGESQLDYAMFRYHNCRGGRFMSPDPLAGSLANPQSLNRYAYAQNDPLNKVDPTGLNAMFCVATFWDDGYGHVSLVSIDFCWGGGGGGGSGSGGEAGGAGGAAYDRRADFRDYATQLSNNREMNNCEKLARLAYKAGQVWGAAGDAVQGMLAGLTEVQDRWQNPSDPNYRVGVYKSDPHYAGGFGDTGFSAPYVDKSNQVRHFAAWFAAGYLWPAFLARNQLYSTEQTRDPKNPDVALGLEAIRMGDKFNGDFGSLAADIWKNICGGTTPLKF